MSEDDWKAKYEALAAQFDQLKETSKEVEEALEDHVQTLEQDNEEVKRQNDALAERLHQLEESYKDLKSERDMLETLAGQAQDIRDKLVRAERTLTEARESELSKTQQAAGEVDQLQAHLRRINDEQKELKDIMRKREQQIDDLQRLNREFQARFTDADERYRLAEERAVLLETDLELQREKHAFLERHVRDEVPETAEMGTHVRKGSIAAKGMAFFSTVAAVEAANRLAAEEADEDQDEDDEDSVFFISSDSKTPMRNVKIGSNIPMRPIDDEEEYLPLSELVLMRTPSWVGPSFRRPSRSAAAVKRVSIGTMTEDEEAIEVDPLDPYPDLPPTASLLYGSAKELGGKSKQSDAGMPAAAAAGAGADSAGTVGPQGRACCTAPTACLIS